MKNIYPEKIEIEEIKLLNRGEVASEVIKQMKEGKTKAQAIGPVLNGSDDVSTFNLVWDEILSEKQKLSNINPKDFKTQTEYLNALEEVANYLDINKWLEGIKEVNDVSSWGELSTKLKEVV